MTSFRKLISAKGIELIFLVSFLAAAGCAEKKEPVEYVAKVEESFLSKDEMQKKLAGRRNETKYREEFIREWIETEVLYHEAISEDVITDTLFNEIFAESKKELAASLLLKRFFAENDITVNKEEITAYYNDRKNEFRFNADTYVFNLIKFSDELKAVRFRNTLIESDWKKALNVYLKDESIIYYDDVILKHDFELTPPILKKVLNHLGEYETSIIFETEPGVFNIVQLVEKIERNEIPALSYVEDEVRSRLVILKRRDLYKEFMEDLYSKYNVVINRYE